MCSSDLSTIGPIRPACSRQSHHRKSTEKIHGGPPRLQVTMSGQVEGSGLRNQRSGLSPAGRVWRWKTSAAARRSANGAERNPCATCTSCRMPYGRIWFEWARLRRRNGRSIRTCSRGSVRQRAAAPFAEHAAPVEPRRCLGARILVCVDLRGFSHLLPTQRTIKQRRCVSGPCAGE